jgi:hypothetical protein
MIRTGERRPKRTAFDPKLRGTRANTSFEPHRGTSWRNRLAAARLDTQRTIELAVNFGALIRYDVFVWARKNRENDETTKPKYESQLCSGKSDSGGNTGMAFCVFSRQLAEK